MYISTAEHAKSIRNDIKAAIKAGTLPKGLVTSVRTKSYSGGSSIGCYVQALPEGVSLYNRAHVAFQMAHPRATKWDMPHEAEERYSPEARAILAKLTEIVAHYHEDNSTDDGGDKCWNVNFYMRVDFDHDLESTARAALEAEITAEQAAPVAPALLPPAARPRVYLRAVSTLRAE